MSELSMEGKSKEQQRRKQTVTSTSETATKSKFTSNKCCCVPQCTSRTVKGEISLHFFPRQAALREKWKSILRIAKPISKAMCVCSKHFKESDFYPKFPKPIYGLAENKRRLKTDALPSLKIPSVPIEEPHYDFSVNKGKGPVKQYTRNARAISDSDINCSEPNQPLQSSDDSQPTIDPIFLDFPVSVEYFSGTSASSSSFDQEPETQPLKRRKGLSDQNQEMIAMMRQLKEEVTKRSAPCPETADYYYCMSLNKRLSKLSPCDNAFAKMRIEEILFKLECGDSE